GFSSGGFASLYSSTLVPCAGYLGFSLVSDLSGTLPLNYPDFSEEAARRGINSKWLVNLRTVLLQSKRFPRRDIFFGYDSPMDIAQARNLEDIPQTRTIGVHDCNHATVASLLESNTLSHAFQSLLFEFKTASVT